MTLLRYGVDATVRLDLSPQALVANCDAPRGTPLADLTDATRHALAAPLNFPPLAQAVVPGDHVAIAVDHSVPQQAVIVAAVVETLLAAGITPAAITVVRTMADIGSHGVDPLALVDPAIRSDIQLETHNPATRDHLSYLAASHEAKPIYINRFIQEADLVVPIGCLRLDDSLGYFGIGGGLYPTFSDEKSLERYRAPRSNDSAVQRKRLRKETEDVSWLLGVTLTVQVVPGAGEDVLHILAGDTASVIREGTRLCQEAWSFVVPERASLVVAAIEGDPSQQTWENVGRALSAASRAVRDDGAIALCTALDERLGPALQQLAHTDDLHGALRQIAKERPSDVLPATQLAHALERNKVYLLSRLDDSVVEELGIAAVESPEQIARLATRHESCIVLANAQHCVAHVENEE